MNAKQQQWQAMNLSQKCYAIGWALFGLAILAMGAFFVFAIIWTVVVGPGDPAPIEVPADRPAATPIAPAAAPRRPPPDLKEARALAERTVRVLDEADQVVSMGIKLKDWNGIRIYALKPVRDVQQEWPRLIDGTGMSGNFWSCQEAASWLSSVITHVLDQERTVIKMRILNENQAKYLASREKCDQQLAMSDGEILRRAAAEEAELQRKFGGRDCLTTYDIDPATGESVALPRPSHCPSQSAR